jgi:hypothetical protein
VDALAFERLVRETERKVQRQCILAIVAGVMAVAGVAALLWRLL